MRLADQPMPTPRNRLLAALSLVDLAHLWPQLEAVELPCRKVLHAPGEPIEAAILIGRIAARTSSCELSLDMGRRL